MRKWIAGGTWAVLMAATLLWTACAGDDNVTNSYNECRPSFEKIVVYGGMHHERDNFYVRVEIDDSIASHGRFERGELFHWQLELGCQ